MNATRVRKHILKCHSDLVPPDIPVNYYSPPQSPVDGLIAQHIGGFGHHLIPKDPKFPDSYQICLNSETLHFSAAHFVAYKVFFIFIKI